MKVSKTNAARMLDRAGVEYELIPYEVDEEYLAATHTAAKLDQDVRQLFKTIVLRGDRNGILVCEVPGDMEVDLKKAASVSGDKSVSPLPLKELQSVTGYIRGGCSPLGMKRLFPTYIDNSALNFDAIFISAGVRGLQIKVDPRKLAEVIGAQFAEVVA